MSQKDFPGYTKKDWLELIGSTMRSASPEDMRWLVGDGLEGLVFAHQDDLSGNPAPFPGSTAAQPWLIGGVFDHPEAFSEDQIMELAALWFKEIPVLSRLHQIRWPEGVREVYFNPGADASDASASLQTIANNRSGWIWEGMPSLHFILDRPAAIDISWIRNDKHGESMPFYLCLQPGSGNENEPPLELLSDFFVGLARKFLELDPPERSQMARRIKLICYVSPNFLYEIAMMRAIQVLWYNLLGALESEPVPCRITGVVNLQTLSGDTNQQLILATPAAMAAVIGGAGTLFLEAGPVDASGQSMKNLAKNLQWILREESGFGQVNDPAAGSYAIEDLTSKISRGAWTLLMKKLG